MSGRLGADARARIDATVGECAVAGRIPGVVAAVAIGDDVHISLAGELAIGGPPVARDSLFRIASTSKPIAGAAAMTLVRDGLLDLDEGVERLLPELAERPALRRPDGPLDETVAADRPVTIRELMAFTFGFGMTMEMFATPEPWPVVAAADELNLQTLGPPDPWVPPDPDSWLARLGSLPLIAQPGERWLYNTGASVLGVLIARATGKGLEEALRERLFAPLAMDDTAFWTAEKARLATAYLATDEGLEVWDGPEDRWASPPAFPDAASGLVASVDDLLAFARMLLDDGGEVLGAAAVREMTRDQLTAGQKARGGLLPDFFEQGSWGLCLYVGADGAFGWDGGLGTSLLIDPARRMIVIVLTQLLFPSPALPREHRVIRAAAYAAADA